MWSKSQPAPRYGKVRAMTLPPSPPDDRRSVPRHLRDSEHDMSGSAPGSGMRAEDARGGLGPRIWIYAAIFAVVAGIGFWFGR
jgi:hypothetical protein